VLESGIEIFVEPPGKIVKNLTALSGGEQAFVAIAIYFAILKVRPAPFCLLDEIEAALDDVNVTRYAQYLHKLTVKPILSPSPTAAAPWRRPDVL
jgi:chromosome segregation protein